MIAEKTGTKEEIITLDGEGWNLEDIKEYFFSKYELSDNQSLQIAVNQSLGPSGSLKDGDEIAFLPPFAGG
ncbi:MoaD/ThiS family protein [Aliifodinibius sp. S!AR15-10]|nr:MoaD/ThiS family protein [Aliifodinibius sp. S!AR15-10]